MPSTRTEHKSASRDAKPYSRAESASPAPSPPLLTPTDELDNLIAPTIGGYVFRGPSLEQYDAIVAGYLNGLSARKREKALISRSMYEDVVRVLDNPGDTDIGTAQFRFWVRKMFTAGVGPGGETVALHEGRAVVTREHIFDVLTQCHALAGHGGRDKTCARIRRQYAWIPKEVVAQFVKACPTCRVKRAGHPALHDMLAELEVPVHSSHPAVDQAEPLPAVAFSGFPGAFDPALAAQAFSVAPETPFAPASVLWTADGVKMVESACSDGFPSISLDPVALPGPFAFDVRATDESRWPFTPFDEHSLSLPLDAMRPSTSSSVASSADTCIGTPPPEFALRRSLSIPIEPIPVQSPWRVDNPSAYFDAAESPAHSIAHLLSSPAEAFMMNRTLVMASKWEGSAEYPQIDPALYEMPSPLARLSRTGSKQHPSIGSDSSPPHGAGDCDDFGDTPTPRCDDFHFDKLLVDAAGVLSDVSESIDSDATPANALELHGIEPIPAAAEVHSLLTVV